MNVQLNPQLLPLLTQHQLNPQVLIELVEQNLLDFMDETRTRFLLFVQVDPGVALTIEKTLDTYIIQDALIGDIYCTTGLRTRKLLHSDQETNEGI